MTNQEFSDEFSTLLNSYANIAEFGDQVSRADIVLDEYEKSVFLTQAQEELVVALYTGKNVYGDTFEDTEEMRRYLEGLVKRKEYTQEDEVSGEIAVSPTSVFFRLPDKLAFIVMEQATYDDESLGCMDGKTVDVRPVTHDEYLRVSRNPFIGATKRRVLRLDKSDGLVEIISDYGIGKYTITYLAKPNPIVLEDLPDNLTVGGENHETACELNPMLHRMILENAVRKALASKIGYRN